jgi:hypothetical protein
VDSAVDSEEWEALIEISSTVALMTLDSNLAAEGSVHSNLQAFPAEAQALLQ